MTGIAPEQVSAVLVTRGDVDLTEIIESLAPLGEVLIWNNQFEHDLAVYGRYHAIDHARSDAIYVQDDDCVLDPGALELLLAAYEPGVVTCNVPERFRAHYPDSGLVGFGAVFDRGLPDEAFSRFWVRGFVTNHRHREPSILVPRAGVSVSLRAVLVDVDEDVFCRRCDNVFTTLTPLKRVDLPYRDLPWASDESRMWRQPGHVGERDRMIELARQVRDAQPQETR